MHIQIIVRANEASEDTNLSQFGSMVTFRVVRLFAPNNFTPDLILQPFHSQTILLLTFSLPTISLP